MSVFKQLFWNTVPFLHQKEKLFTSFTFFGTLFSFQCRQLQSKLTAWLITNPVFADFSLVFAVLPGEVTSSKNVLDAGICLQGLCAASASPSSHGTLLSSWFGIAPCPGCLSLASSAGPYLSTLSTEEPPLSSSLSFLKLKEVWKIKLLRARQQRSSNRAFSLMLHFHTSPFTVCFIWLGAEITFNFISCACCSGWKVVIRSLSDSFNILSARA